VRALLTDIERLRVWLERIAADPADTNLAELARAALRGEDAPT
jgi:hypothetical protein